MSPVRLLIVAPWAERAGGAEQMLSTILRNLDRTLIDPEVGFLSKGPFEAEIRSLGIPTWSLPATRLRDPLGYSRTVVALEKVLRRGGFNAVLAWSAKVHLYLGPARLVVHGSTRAVWWQHSIPTGEWMDRLATLIPADAVGCSSRAGEASQRRLSPRRPTFVVHPGIDRPSGGQPLTRDQIGLDPDAWVVGIVGRLQAWKGQDKVIRAVAELRRGGIDAVALIVGGTSFGLSPDYEQRLNALVDTLDLRDSVTFTGEVPDASGYYPLMDVVVNASSNEPFGIVVIEAMAAGRPVVALRAGGPAEIIEHGVNGILLSEDEIVDGLAALWADPQRAIGLGRAARRRAQRFDGESAATRFADAIERICGRT